MTHYKGKIYAWDVVNEVFEFNGTLRRDSIYYQNFGESYIADAFILARQTDPSTKLYINDYAIESISDKSNGLYEFVKKLRNEGVPIDGVGFQCHFNIGEQVPAVLETILKPLNPNELEQVLKRFIDLGVEVSLTELDVGSYEQVDDSLLQKQAEDFATSYKICKSLSRCVGVTTWDYTDKYTYAPERSAALWDTNIEPKPAVKAVKKALRK